MSKRPTELPFRKRIPCSSMMRCAQHRIVNFPSALLSSNSVPALLKIIKISRKLLTIPHPASRQPYVSPSYIASRKVMVIARLLLFASFLLPYLLTLLSMGDNLLLMDSPAPNLQSSGAVSRRAYTDPSTAQHAESPCGVDKLLNFSPSKLSEVTSQNLSQK